VASPSEPENPRTPRAARILSAAASTAQVFGLLVVAYILLFHLSVVRGASMNPGIHDGDRILVEHLPFVFGGVRRGDIVVLRCPVDPTLDYIKRVIGLPGDEVRIENGSVFVNGTVLDEPYVDRPDRRSKLLERVAPDHYFVLGDNREHSSDSREFGQVSRQLLRGRVDLRVWPPDRAGAVL
jgi:signal peptidase I